MEDVPRSISLEAMVEELSKCLEKRDAEIARLDLTERQGMDLKTSCESFKTSDTVLVYDEFTLRTLK